MTYLFTFVDAGTVKKQQRFTELVQNQCGNRQVDIPKGKTIRTKKPERLGQRKALNIDKPNYEALDLPL